MGLWCSAFIAAAAPEVQVEIRQLQQQPQHCVCVFQVYGQLPQPVLFQAKRWLQQPCRHVFLLGFPTLKSPTPFLYSLLLQRQGMGHVCSSFFPPRDAQHRYLELRQNGGQLQPAAAAEAEFDYWLQRLLRKNRALFGGASVTIPFKEKVLPYIDRIHPSAKAVGAVRKQAFPLSRFCHASSALVYLASSFSSLPSAVALSESAFPVRPLMPFFRFPVA